MWTTQKNILRNEYEYEDGAQLVNNTPKAGLFGWWRKPGGHPRPVNRGVHMILSDISAPQRSGQPLPTKWTTSKSDNNNGLHI
jgi:hypothetical protein